jgi:hypothetical protein
MSESVRLRCSFCGYVIVPSAPILATADGIIHEWCGDEEGDDPNSLSRVLDPTVEDVERALEGGL